MDALADQIQKAFEREQERGIQSVVSANELPQSYESITDTWLTDVLCRKVPGAEVIGHTLGPVDNGSSNRRKVGVQYNDAGISAALPQKLFCKASHSLENRFVLGMSGAAEFEANFYNKIREHVNMEATRAVYARVDQVSFNAMAILLDISDEVSGFCDHDTPVSREMAESQMRTLAALHGAGFAKATIRAQFDQFMKWPDFFRRCAAFGLEDGCVQGFQDAEEVIPARLFARSDEIWSATLRSAEIQNSLPLTFCHGDVHLKNWYIAGVGTMGISDWQNCHVGHWSRDIAYALSTALTVENRRAWERELVAIYLDELASNGGPRVAFEDGFFQYRQQLMTVLAWWTITLHPAPGLPEMQPRATSLNFLERIATAIDDLDTLQVI